MANNFFFDESDFQKAFEEDQARFDEKINQSMNSR